MTLQILICREGRRFGRRTIFEIVSDTVSNRFGGIGPWPGALFLRLADFADGSWGNT